MRRIQLGLALAAVLSLALLQTWAIAEESAESAGEAPPAAAAAEAADSATSAEQIESAEPTESAGEPAATDTPATAEAAAESATVATPEKANEAATPSAPATPSTPIKPGKIASFVGKGIEWLIAAQHPDGGWGGGSHAAQQIRDPHQVVTDPATTSFTLLSLLRAGHTPAAGEHKEQVRRGLEYLVATVEKAPSEGPRITDVTGTQPQSKLGPLVDTSLTAQYLARALAIVDKADPLHARVDKALDKCLAKLQQSQKEDGSWGQGGGWAPVLQSSLSCSALEIAQANGKQVDGDVLAAAQRYQKGQVQGVGGGGGGVAGGRAGGFAGGIRVKTEAAAGVELYAFNGAFRGNAIDAREAEDSLRRAIDRGELPPNAPATAKNLEISGVTPQRAPGLAEAAEQNRGQLERFDDEQLLAGFGNNGGEEFLSYLLASESLVIAGGDKFHAWNDKMHGRLQKIQNEDGSWSGHHCITSPVFCTAAVVQCLTTDRDATFLVAMAEKNRPTGEEKTEVAQK